MTQTRTLNLTPLFVVWSLIFVAVAVATSDLGYLWWAAGPWLVLLAFGMVVWLFTATVLYSKYRQGHPITLTTRKGVRVVRRGAEPVWKVRL